MPFLTLPFPPNALRVNRKIGQKWYTNKKAKQDYQTECAAAARRQCSDWEGKPVAWPTLLRVYFYLGKAQRADSADCGAWIKEGLDVLTVMGVWPDDGSKYLSGTTVEVLRDRDDPRVVLFWGDDAVTLDMERPHLLAAELARGGRMVRASRGRP